MKTATKKLILRYAKEPKTTRELACMLGIAKRNVQQNLRQLINLNQVSVCGTVPNKQGSPSPLYVSNYEQ